MNRKILARVSALLCAVIMGIIPLGIDIINADAKAMYDYSTVNKKDMFDYPPATYAEDGHKVVDMTIAGYHYTDIYQYVKDHDPSYGYHQIDGSYGGLISFMEKDYDKTYKDYYKKYAKLCHEYPCMQYAVCRVHELTGKWLNNKDCSGWANSEDFVRSDKLKPYSIEEFIPTDDRPRHAQIIEDIDKKNKISLISQNYKDLKCIHVSQHADAYTKSITFIYFGNAVAKKRIKDHIKECGDHIIYTTVEAPTCTKKGVKIATCSKCGWVCDPAIEVAPTHHKYVKSFDGIKQPITLGDYKAKYVCEDCGRTLHRKTYTINDIRTIDRKSHYHDKKADEIYIGVNTTSIGDNAFNGCTNVSYIEIDSKKLKSIGKNAFKNTGRKQFRKHRWAGGSVTSERLTVCIPAKQFKKYKKMLLKAGIDKRTEFKKLHGSVKHMAEEDEAGVVESWDDENDDGTIVEVR